MILIVINAVKPAPFVLNMDEALRLLIIGLMLHPRYDTSVIMEGDKCAKIQFRELLSLGFAHKFY